MTKEELKKEAEEWLCNNLHSASEEDFIKAMVDIAEPREKRIAELEEENAELKEQLEVVIALKNEEMGCIETDFNTFKSKAKEIIKTCLGFMQAFGYSPSIDKFVTEAEQFLNSEVEK